ncbi:MAG: ComEA family DNA-binding protein [Chitinophagaceae bacterium]
MKWESSIAITVLAASAFFIQPVFSQDIPVQLQQQLESFASANEEETEDDTYWQQLEKFSRHPLNLNSADAEDLKELGVLNELQIENLLRYRNLFGKLVDVHELQAVPSWYPALIRRLMPFVTVAAVFTVKEGLAKRFRQGSHSLLLRIAQVLEKSKGFDPGTGNGYLGSPQKIFARYRYSYKNLLQFGWVGDKDAGEPFLKGAQRYGFDFNSFHLFARKIGIVEDLALGDFTVNMGQGLIHWQSLSFKKSGETMAIKKQSPVLRPYNSAGEFNFHRGLGITVRKKNIEMTGFISFRKLSANLVKNAAQQTAVSSIQTSGYHRTTAEIARKKILTQFSAGANARYKAAGWQLGINAVQYKFSIPVEKRDELYNLYAIKGDDWANYSFDYSYTHRNIHLFGEAAMDKKNHTAFINGCMISLDSRVDISLVHRRLAKEYQAMNASAFTENASPSNETGLYTGLSIRPASNWKLDAFADIYQFPWLKYLIDAPSYGKEFFLQLTCTPDKKLEIQTRLTRSHRLTDTPANTTVMNYLSVVQRSAWQIQMNYIMSTAFTFRSRLQLLWLNGNDKENGFSFYMDGIYKPSLRPFSFSARLQYFETSGYNSRLYAYENDVLYSSGIPALFGAGYRYYLIIQGKPLRQLLLGLRYAATIYTSQSVIGTGLDQITGAGKSEIKAQLLYTF